MQSKVVQNMADGKEKCAPGKVVGADPDFRRVGDETVCPGCDLHFKSSSPSLAMTCRRCKLRGFQFPDNVPTCEGCGTRGLCFVVDDVHWKMWVPFPPEIMQRLWEAADPEKVVTVSKTTTSYRSIATRSEATYVTGYRVARSIKTTPDQVDVAVLATGDERSGRCP